MTGARPLQAAFTRGTDMAKTAATRKVIEDMVDGLNDHRIDDMDQFSPPVSAGWATTAVAPRSV